jgi:hypothetical protein
MELEQEPRKILPAPIATKTASFFLAANPRDIEIVSRIHFMRIKIRIKTLDESGSRSSLYDE